MKKGAPYKAPFFLASMFWIMMVTKATRSAPGRPANETSAPPGRFWSVFHLVASNKCARCGREAPRFRYRLASALAIDGGHKLRKT